MSLDCAACPVRDRAACSVLGPDERVTLAKTGRSRVIAPGEVLFAAGAPSDACATLLRGALKVTSVDAQGHARILALIHPAGFVGELFQPFARHDVVALTECELCVFAGSHFARAVDDYPALARALLRRREEDLLDARDLLDLASSNVPARERVGRVLLALARAASDSPCHPAARFDLPLSRGELAEMLGLTIETVSRSLTALERDGAIRRHGKRGIELIDPARLSSVN